MKLKKFIFPLLAVTLLIAADQLTKWLAVEHLMGKAPVVLWEGVFELRYLENRGAAFGIFQNQMIVFFILTVVIGAGLIWFYSKIPEKRHYFLMRIPVAVCFAGAVGNFIDRVLRGYVVDFFYFKLIDFPIFNVADIYITCSAFFFVLLFIFKYKEDDFNFLSRNKRNGKEGAKIQKTGKTCSKESGLKPCEGDSHGEK